MLDFSIGSVRLWYNRYIDTVLQIGCKMFTPELIQIWFFTLQNKQGSTSTSTVQAPFGAHITEMLADFALKNDKYIVLEARVYGYIRKTSEEGDPQINYLLGVNYVTEAGESGFDRLCGVFMTPLAPDSEYHDYEEALKPILERKLGIRIGSVTIISASILNVEWKSK